MVEWIANFSSSGNSHIIAASSSLEIFLSLFLAYIFINYNILYEIYIYIFNF